MIERPALLLIGHGTRSEVGVAQYFQLAQAIRDLDPELTVGCGFIELVKPTLDEAIDELVGSGVQAVVGVPLVLLGAGHLKNDGPVALAGGRLRHPEVSFSYARELGLHPHVLDVVDDRIAQTVHGLRPPAGLGKFDTGDQSDGGTQSDGGDETMVVLVGRGSSDPDANADLYKAARLLSDSRGLPPVEPAFVSLAPPSVTEALDRCARLGAKRIAVVPYFLFTGVLPQRLGDQAQEWAAEHPDISVVVGDEMGPDPRIAALVLERYGETLGQSPPVMNCDLCLYRQALPGYETKLGQAQGDLAHIHEH